MPASPESLGSGMDFCFTSVLTCLTTGNGSTESYLPWSLCIVKWMSEQMIKFNLITKTYHGFHQKHSGTLSGIDYSLHLLLRICLSSVVSAVRDADEVHRIPDAMIA